MTADASADVAAAFVAAVALIVAPSGWLLWLTLPSRLLLLLLRLCRLCRCQVAVGAQTLITPAVILPAAHSRHSAASRPFLSGLNPGQRRRAGRRAVPAAQYTRLAGTALCLETRVCRRRAAGGGRRRRAAGG